MGKGTTDETFTTSENISINVDEIFVSLYIITLSMFLSINVSMYLSLANEREKECTHCGFLIIESRTHHIYKITKITNSLANYI